MSKRVWLNSMKSCCHLSLSFVYWVMKITQWGLFPSNYDFLPKTTYCTFKLRMTAHLTQRLTLFWWVLYPPCCHGCTDQDSVDDWLSLKCWDTFCITNHGSMKHLFNIYLSTEAVFQVKEVRLDFKGPNLSNKGNTHTMTHSTFTYRPVFCGRVFVLNWIFSPLI